MNSGPDPDFGGDTTNRSCPKRCAQPRRGCRWVGDVMGERITISSVAACALNTGFSAIFSSKNQLNRSLPSAGTHTLITAVRSVCATRFNSGDTTNRSCLKRCMQPRRGWAGDELRNGVAINSGAACAHKQGFAATFNSRKRTCKGLKRAESANWRGHNAVNSNDFGAAAKGSALARNPRANRAGVLV